jgi:parallel beta-helix repeat protein
MVVPQSHPTASTEPQFVSPKFVYSLVGLSLLSSVPSGWMAPIVQAAEVPSVAQPHSKATTPTPRTQQAANLTILHVHPAQGNDSSGKGSQQAPLKTITHALAIAQPNTVILLAPGNYTIATGEAFPIKLKAGVTVQGNPNLRGQSVVIQGGGEFLSPTFASQNVAIVGANGAGLTGVTVTNSNPRGYGLWIESTNPLVMDNTFTGNTHDGVSVTGNSAPILRNNTFSKNGANGLSVLNAATPQVQGNVFEQNGFGVNIAQKAAPVLLDNRIIRNQDGVIVQAEARPKLRRNLIESNQRDGLVAIADSLPDLGTSTESGDNVFRSNGQLDVNARASSQIIPAYGNQILITRVTGRVDLVGALAQMQAIAPDPISEQKVAVEPEKLQIRNVSASVERSIEVEPKQKQLDRSIEVEPNQKQVALIGYSKHVTVSDRAAHSPVGRDFVHSTRRRSEPALPPLPARKQQQTVSTRSTQGSLSAASFPVPGSLSAAKPSTKSATAIASTAQVSQPSTRSTRSPQTATAIQIPVPPPETSAPTNRLPKVAAPARPTTPTQATQLVATQSVETDSLPTVAVSPIRVTRRPSTATVQPTTRRLANSNRSLPKPAKLTTSTSITGGATPVAMGSAASTRSTTSLTPTTRTVTPTTGSIEITVPPPESTVLATASVSERSVPPSISKPKVAIVSENAGRAVSNPELLPVPSPNIPMGNSGDAANVFIARATQPDEPPMPPMQGTAISLRYRVVVETLDEQERSQVRSIVPDAFQIVSSGRAVMQVGAFGDRTNADQMQQMLSGQGLRATVEQL